MESSNQLMEPSRGISKMADRLQRGFLILLFFQLGIQTSYSYAIVEEPSDQIVDVGSNVVLPCLVDSQRHSSQLHVLWYRSTTDATTSTTRTQISANRMKASFQGRGRYSVTGTGYRFDLSISDVRDIDNGYYYCALYVQSMNDYLYSNIARVGVVDISVKPMCGVTSPGGSSDIGDRVTVTCFPATADLAASLKMWKGTQATMVARARRWTDGRLTQTVELTEDDRNRPYTCTPTNRYPDVNNCTVIPLRHHTITLTPSKGIAELGGDIRFSCSATGTPPFNTFSWVVGYGRNNVLRLTKSSGRYIVSTNGNSGRLTITDVQLSDNNTAVRCRASNSLEEQVGKQAKVFIAPLDNIPLPDIPSAVTTPNSIDRVAGIPNPGLTTPSVVLHSNEDKVSYDGDKYGESGGVVSSNSSMVRPASGGGGTIIAILLSLLVILVLVAMIILYVRKRQGKPTPRILKRLSINRPLALKKFSFNKPRFVGRVSMSKGVQSAQNTIEVVHRRISTMKCNPADTADKRTSLRESEIEVVVNPPPPDWQFRNVEDVDKMQRKRLISRHAPSGDYSHKEIDLLNSLMTGNVQTKTLDKNDVTNDDNVVCDNDDDDDADSQFESDFEEDEFDDSMSDSGNRSIDPSPRAPPRRKRVRRRKTNDMPDEHLYDSVAVAMDTTDASRGETEGTVDSSASSKDAEEAPLYSQVNKTQQNTDGPTYAEVNRSTKSARRK